MVHGTQIAISVGFISMSIASAIGITLGALKSVGMVGFIDHYPNQLSIGMRQRVNLARGIAAGTEILLMDEPFAALDEQTRMVLGEDLSTLLAETGKTIVFVTHSLAEAVFLSDRIALMTARPGRIKTILSIDVPHPVCPASCWSPASANGANAMRSCATRSAKPCPPPKLLERKRHERRFLYGGPLGPTRVSRSRVGRVVRGGTHASH
jgi:ABC-type nitrate/sulfonate/bicarbonate transport system ATPase subunit